MMGCLGRVGCLVILVMILVLSVAAWFARDWVMDNVPFGQRHATQQAAVWQSATPDGAKRATASLAALQRRGGPVFANVTPGDMLAYILKEFAAVLPKSADSIQASVVGERLHIRARVRTADLGSDVLGPMAYVLKERERIEFGGTLRVIRPGLSEYQVKTFRVRDVALPQSVLPLLIRRLSGVARPKELSEDGLPLLTPEYIGDVRVANGRITVYKKQ
jgi:hypothetical protein